MNLSNLSVGIDYHQASLRVCVLSPEGKHIGSRDLDNSVEAVMQYVSGYGSVKGVAIEACTGSAHFVDELRRRSGWVVDMCHPGYVQRMRHNPDKSDASDSWLLSDLQRVGYLPKVWLAPECLRDLRTVARFRHGLTEGLRSDKLRVRAILRRERIKPPNPIRDVWSKRGRAWLKSIDTLSPHTEWVFKELLNLITTTEQKIDSCTERLIEFGKQDPIIEKLMNEPGIGIVTATMLRAEIGTFTRFQRGKELSRFCGMTPRNASSGTRQADAGLVKAGNPILKMALIQVGHNLCRHHPTYQHFAKKLIGRGKKVCVVVAAVINRWLRKLFYVMRDFEINPIQALAN